MSRTVPEWIGSSDDAPVPARVRARVFIRDGGKCRECGRKLHPGDIWTCDHRKALINGGENRETNLGVICEWCDDHVKTPADVAEKRIVARKQKKHLGIKSKSRNPIPGSRDSGWKRRLTSEGPRTGRR